MAKRAVRQPVVSEAALRNRQKQANYRTRSRLSQMAVDAVLRAETLEEAQAKCRAVRDWTPGQKEPTL